MSSLATKIVLEEVIEKLNFEIVESLTYQDGQNDAEAMANMGYLAGIERAIKVCKELM